MKTTSYVPLLLSLAIALVLAGCGGSGDPEPTATDQSALTFGKVAPNLDAFRLGLLQSKTLPENLAWNSKPVPRKVRGTQCTWFRTPMPTRNRIAVIMVQQAPAEDSDLYVFNNWPMRPNWKIGQSSRFANDTMPDYTSMGVPDWVACTLTKATGAGYIMVYGESAATMTNQFTVENDLVATLSKTGTVAHGSANYRDSRWYRFPTTSGKLHTITCTAPAGSNPDMVLYDANSAGYKASDYTANAGGKITFTATNTHMHYLRVFGNAVGTTSTYDLKLVIAP